MMELPRDEAAHICEYADGREQYDSVSRTLQVRDNVCMFTMRGYSEPGRVLVRHSRFMTLSGSPCPVQTDKRYIPVAQISEGLFAILAGFAAEIASSPAAFDAAVVEGMTKRPDYAMLRRGVLDDDPRSKFRLEAMTLTEEGLPRPVRYRFVFQSPNLPIRSLMEVDFTPGGWKIFSFGRVQ